MQRGTWETGRGGGGLACQSTSHASQGHLTAEHRLDGEQERRRPGTSQPASQPDNGRRHVGRHWSSCYLAGDCPPGERERAPSICPSIARSLGTRFPGETHQRRTVPSAAKRCARHSVSPVSGRRRSSFGGQAPSPSAWVEPQTGEMICATGARAGARWSPLETAGGVAARAQQHAIAVPLAPACQGMLREAQGGTEKPSWAPPAGPT